MSRGAGVLVLALLLACLPQLAATAADIRVVQPDRFDDQHNGSIDVDAGLGNNLRNDAAIVCNVQLDGPIEPGDLDRLKGAVAALQRRRPDKTPRVCLNSEGGSYPEGLEISKYLMAEGIGTAVEADAECHSSCALIFMGGSYPWKGEINRFLHVTGIVGFHAPYVRQLADKQYGEKDMRDAFDTGIRAITELMKLGVGNKVKRFPPELMNEMLKKGPDEVFTIDTVGKAIRYRVHAYGVAAPPAVNQRTLCNACVNINYGAYESYGTGGETDLCASPGEVKRQRYPKGFRLIFQVAPRGGTCMMDLAQQGTTVTGWMYQPDDRGKWWDGLELAYWYLYTPSTQLADLAGPTLAPPGRTPPARAPAQAPPARGSAADRDELYRQIVNFVGTDYLGQGLIDHESRPELYGPQVQYYDKGTLPRAAVMADKNDYYAKWPRRKYEMIPNSMSSRQGAGDSVDFTFRYTFEVSDGRRTIRGTGATTLGLVTQDGRLLIVRETGQVLDRQNRR